MREDEHPPRKSRGTAASSRIRTNGQPRIEMTRANLPLVTDNVFVLEKSRNILVGERSHAFGSKPSKARREMLHGGQESFAKRESRTQCKSF